MHRALSEIEPTSEQFAALQRTYFGTMEKYLDAGAGACWLKHPGIAEPIVRELTALKEWHINAPHYSIMPNHWHALLIPASQCERSLSEILKRLKGRTAKNIREAVGGRGAVWQREWFDRWIRDDGEWEKTVNYIRQNPVKAGLVSRWEDHAWTR
ncbi:MAG TPA: transposase [Opitutaceae bacterium]|nr:transposase [Opitutaceae bacterium]